MKKIILFLSIMVIFSSLLFGELDKSRSNAPLAKSTISSDIWINANRMNGIMRNNGTWLYDNPASTWGLEWPKGSGLSPVFAAGQWIGARVNGEVVVSGIKHDATEFQPGVITAPGVATNWRDSQYRWYTLRSGGVGDWANWPIDQGAPLDADGNPLLLGDMSSFCVWNDLAPHTTFGSNGRLNAEIRQYVWSYTRADALGDMIFIKFTIVNKGDANWDDTYFTLWSDPDVGDAGDDFVGCDTTLGLGMCYNADNDDQNYGAAPPALGFDFFQGPIVKEEGSQVVLPDGTTFEDSKMLKMTSFVYYNNNDNTQNGSPDFANQVYNLQRSYWLDGSAITEGGTGVEFPNNPQTAFMFSGDPVTGTGWNDSNEDDRRFIMTTGPFNMTNWEPNNPLKDLNNNGIAEFGEVGVQEIVVGIIMARGTDNLNSVTKLKEVDKLAQLAYDVNFNLASPPAVPEVVVSEDNNTVVLNWSNKSEFLEDRVTSFTSTDPIIAKAIGDTVIMDNIQKVVSDSTYNFYGYSVYQYSDAGGSNPVQIDHWDNGGTPDAQNYTQSRFLRITTNKNGEADIVGNKLVNGRPYYFGVVAEAYCEFGAPLIMESAVDIVTVYPKTDLGGRTFANFNDSLLVTHIREDTTMPYSQGDVTAWVLDPTKLTGDDYQVRFYNNSHGEAVWTLLDESGDSVLTNQHNQNNDDAYDIVDGLMVKVAGAQPSILTCSQVATDDWNTVVDANLIGSLNWNQDYNAGKPVFIMSADGADFGDETTQFARWDWRGNTTPNDIVIEFVENPETEGQLIFSAWADAGASAAGNWLLNGWAESDTVGGELTYHDTGGRLPFKVWMITPTGVRTQIIAGIIDDDDDWYWNITSGGPFVNDDEISSWERIYICNHPYNEAEFTADGGNSIVNDIFWGSTWDAQHSLGRVKFSMYYDLWSDAATGAIWGMPPAPGTVIRWNSAKPNSTNDYYTFSAPEAMTKAVTDKKDDLKKILAVPNPYYGYHQGEMNIFQRWVQFTNLPEECTIRIFDLAGNQISKLEKDDPTTTFMQWDLSNQYGLPVASGIYVYHVDVPDVGEKVGKLAIFAPNERMDTY